MRCVKFRICTSSGLPELTEQMAHIEVCSSWLGHAEAELIGSK